MKSKRRGSVPRSSLREKLDNLRQRDRDKEVDPWEVDIEPREKKPIWEGYPFTVFKEMHQNLFPKVMGCLSIILLVLLFNVINIPVTNTLGDGVYSLVVWNMDVAAIPSGAVEVITSLRGGGDTNKDVTVTISPEEKDTSLPVSNATIHSDYGIREHPARGNEMHYGIDLAIPSGTPIQAIMDGTVLSLEEYSDYGLGILIDHGEGVRSYYAPVEDVNIEAGNTVKKGQEIAVTTSIEGVSYLHFEVWVDDRPVNPRELISFE